MRRPILLLSAGAALSLFACLVAPDEPRQTTTDLLSCGNGSRTFNGSCRKVCTASADCEAGSSCTNVGGDVALCLDYQHCAYLGSDTSCDGLEGGHSSNGYWYDGYWYDGYWYDDSSWADWDYGWDSYGFDPYYPSSPYGETNSPGARRHRRSCTGNATWQLIPPSGDPRCGGRHDVVRCAPVAGHCQLVPGSTTDIAER